MTEEGNKYDSGKPRLDLIPPEAEYALGCVLAYGAGKYADRNWEKGFAWGRSVGALKRHLTAWEAGQDSDPESGLPHLWHVLTNAAFLVAFESRGVGTDDRPQGCAVRLWDMQRGGVPSSGSEEEDRQIAAAVCAISCPHGASGICTQPCGGSGICPLRPGEMIPVKGGKNGPNLLKYILERQKNHIATDYEQEIAREYASMRGWQLGVTPLRVWF